MKTKTTVKLFEMEKPGFSTIGKYFIEGFDIYFNKIHETYPLMIEHSKKKLSKSNEYTVYIIMADGHKKKVQTTYISPSSFILHKTNLQGKTKQTQE